ncbi:glycosyltransferase [Thiotrichales bacterium 19S11-10]|nr:glycosyltransferase [Thiotrichales bacterium 19S11-10]
MKLSICIPTYNRAKYLLNCLSSIASADHKNHNDIEYCISDNASTDDTADVVKRFQNKLNIKYHRNIENIGIARNFLHVVSMARGEFVWMIGDDDLVLPSALKEALQLLDKNPAVDYFYVNAYHLTTEYVLSYSQPFDLKHLPPISELQPFSNFSRDGKLAFSKLIDPKVSFDFLGGIFLSIFRREIWASGARTLNQRALSDKNMFSSFDNTFPHVKIFANTLMKSQAYFHQKPLSICLTGAREWSPMYPLIHSVRLVEALEEYRKNGLPFFRYIYCRNFALNNFLPDIGAMFVYRKHSGYQYINPVKLYIKNALYPNTYFSLLRFFYRKLYKLRKYLT